MVVIDNDDDDDNGKQSTTDDGSLSGWPVWEGRVKHVPTSLLVQMKNERDISHSRWDISHEGWEN